MDVVRWIMIEMTAALEATKWQRSNLGPKEPLSSHVLTFVFTLPICLWLAVRSEMRT
jgi:hypothetical protein